MLTLKLELEIFKIYVVQGLLSFGVFFVSYFTDLY